MRVALKSLYLIVLICVLHAPAFALDSEKPKDSETTEDSEVSSAMDIGIGGGNGSEEPFPHLGDLQSKYSTYQFDVLGDNLAGEHIDIDSGSLSLTNIDISVPGNSALPVQFGRSRSRNGFKASWLGDWVPNIPYISRHYLDLAGANSDRCTGSVYPTPYEVFGPYGSYKIKPESWFEGLSLNIPGKNPGAPGLIFSGSISPEFSGTNARMITKNNWLIKCFASSVNGGDGFTVIAPNGDTYKFEYIKTAFERSVNVGQMLDYNVYLEVLFATEVKDRHGNWVKYDYSSGKLTAIRANDGRQIDFTYSNNRIATATTNNRTWTYSYNGGGELTQVTLPDGRYWGLSTSTHALDPWVASICAFHNSTTVPSAIVRHPSGTTVQFDFTVIMNGRTNADIGIPGRDFESPPLDACFVGGVHSISPTAYYAFSVTKKTVTVPSAGTYVWERNYEQDSGSYSNSSLQLPDTKKRTLTDPNGDKTVFYVNRRNGLLEGTIKKIEVIPSGSNTPIKVTESEYLTGNSIGTDMKSGGVGIAPTGVSTTRIYKTKETITQDGVSYTTDYTFQTTPSASDFAYNEPKRITQSSTLPNVGTRITEYTYTHYKTPWIIALRDTVTRNGKLFEDHSYHSSTGKRLTTKTMGSNFNSLSHLYYSDGTLKSTTNALGKTVTYSNYKRGIAQTISLPENITAYHVVDNNGWVTGFTDGNGVTTGYQYNSVGWLTYIDRVSPWSDTAITYHNLASSSFYQKVVTGAKETVNYFDGLHRLRKVRLRPLYDGGITSYVSYDYDGLSQKTFQSLPSTSSSPTNGTNTTYDALGRVTQIKENFNPYVTISKQYISGNRTRTTDPRGYQTTTSRSGYGSPDDGNITDIVSPEGVTTSLDYDIYGNIETLTQSGTSNGYSVSNTREWSYDSRLRVCRQYTSETGSSVFRYNNIDNVIEYAQGMSGTTGCLSSIPSSSRITNVYDDLGRLDEILYPGSTPDIDLEYDGNSNITRNVRGGVSWDYEYNSAGLLEREDLSIDGRSYYATYNYNGDMAVVSHQSPSGQTVNFYPNGLGQTTTIEKSTNNHQYISNVIYHVNGHVDTYSMANGIDANVNFNSRHLPNRIQALKGATKIIDFGYVYDKSSNVTSITDYAQSGQNRTLTYDGLDRLLTADGPWGSGAFKYDSLGNLREKKLGSRVVSMDYNTLNRLTAYKDTQQGSAWRDLSYDNRGNVTDNYALSSQGLGFVYDMANQPVEMNKTISGDYVYDGNFKRVKQVVDGTTTYSFYSQSGALLLIDNISNTAEDHDYYHLNGALVLTIKGSDSSYTEEYQHTDHLGSPVAATNNAGNVVWRENFTPYGEKRVNPSQNEDSISYTGHVTDSSGLVYMQARYYDPVIGRFYSNDPVDALTFLNQGNVHGFNRYAYANNNPYRFIDPDGKAAQESFEKWSTSWTSIKNSAVNAISGVGELAQQTGDSVGGAISSSTSPENLRTASNDMATIAVGATLVGQVEVAAPAVLLSTALGYAAAVQGDNPVQEVVVEAVVNFSAKPIGIVSKGAATKLEGNVRNGVESAGQFLENEYKDLIKSEK